MERKSWIFGWVKDNYDKVFLAVLAIAFAIRIWIFLETFQQPLWWDAADYLATAKRWAGMNLNNIWYYRRGFLWPLISAGFFITRLGEGGIRLLEVLLSTGIVGISYFLIKDMFNKRLALLASIGLAGSWIMLFFTGRPLTSIPATFFLLLALLFFWKGYILKQGNRFLYLFAVFYALSILTRMQYLLFGLPFLVLIFSKEKFGFLKNKKLWMVLLIFLLILSPQIISYTMHYGNPVTDIARYYFGISAIPSATQQTTERSLGDMFDYILEMPYILSGTSASFFMSLLSNVFFVLLILGAFLFFADLVIGFDKLFQSDEVQKKLFILLWIIVLFFVLGYITIYVEHRYVIPALPFIFMIAFYPIIKFAGLLHKKNINKKFAAVIVFTLIIFLMVPNLLWTNHLTESKKTSYLEVKQAGEWIKENSNFDDVVLSVSLPQIMYYSERPTYPFDMASEQFRRRDPSIKEYGEGREGFENFIKDKKPKYLIVSAFEVHPDWIQQYLQENQGASLNPVQAYYQNEQPVLIIYEFAYN